MICIVEALAVSVALVYNWLLKKRKSAPGDQP